MIEVYKHDEKAKIPTRAFTSDAGLDLYALEDIEIPLGHTMLIDTGISVHIPEGSVGKIEDRSSLAARGLRTGAGVIDSGYNGRIKVVMHNFSDSSQSLLVQHDCYFTTSLGCKIKAGDKIAQILVYKVETSPIVEVSWLWSSSRNNSGFGSTGA